MKGLDFFFVPSSSCSSVLCVAKAKVGFGVVFLLLTTGVGEVDDVAVLLEHVDLLNTLDGLDVQLLESGLELLVIGARVADDLLDLAAGGTLATVKFVSWLDIGRLKKCGWLGVDEWVNMGGGGG